MFKDLISRPDAPYAVIWIAVFLYVALVAVFVQIIALPYIVPTWHAGNGLMIGGDWIWFNQMAVEMSDSIRINGWQEWTLRPHGQAPAGIAAAIYALVVPKPWTIIPLNAILHASAALLLILIMQCLNISWQYAAASALPFTLFPSAMTWYTQLHKDGFFILGFLIFLYGWILLTEAIINARNIKTLVKPYLYILFGAAIVWVVRPYGVQMMQGLALIMAVGLVLWGILQIRQLPDSIKMRLFIIPTFLLCLIASLTPFTWQGIGFREPLGMETPAEIPAEYWKQTLPSKLDNMFYTFATVRNGFIDSYPDAGSNIDTHIRFHSVTDFLYYTPRAIQIALFAPFPNMWLYDGNTINGGLIRKVTGFEMLIIYGCLIFAVVSFKKWRTNPAWWIIIYYCGGMMTFYAFNALNIGSFYRVRYGFIMTIAALGISYLLNEIIFKPGFNTSYINNMEIQSDNLNSSLNRE